MDFLTAFTLVVAVEGNYVNDPQDPGGETKFGISKRSYPNLDIKSLTLDSVKPIYLADFWNKLRCDDLPDAIRHFVFDTGVQCGEDWAAMSVQRAVGALPDGNIGPRTLAEVKARDPNQILRLIFVDRAFHYASDPNVRRFGRGWFARLFDISKLAIVTANPHIGSAVSSAIPSRSLT